MQVQARRYGGVQEEAREDGARRQPRQGDADSRAYHSPRLRLQSYLRASDSVCILVACLRGFTIDDSYSFGSWRG